MASGHSNNTISLWRLNKDYPLATLANRQGTEDQIVPEISSVCFAMSQNEIFSGDNTGSFCVWDIRNQALIKTFKEHSARVSCVFPSPIYSPDFLVITGSHDSTIKEWDIRQKGSVATYTDHKMKVNCIDFSPDGKLFITGSDDCTLKFWDLRKRKCLKTFDLHKAPITCAKFNPEEISLAAASADGMLSYWSLESWELMYKSNYDATSIQQLAFTNDGKYLFTAVENALRVWKVDSEKMALMQNIDSKWNNISDLVIQNGSKSPTNALIGAALGQNTIELWGSAFEDLEKNLKEPITVFTRSQVEKTQEEEEQEIPDAMLQPMVKGRPTVCFEHFSDVVKFESPAYALESARPSISGIIEGIEEKEEESQEPEQEEQKEKEAENGEVEQSPVNGDAVNGNKVEPEAPRIEENLQFNELLESTRDLRASIVHLEKLSIGKLDVNSYLAGISGEEKTRELDAIGEIRKDHAKFEASIIQRAQNIREISSMWKTERALKTLPQIERFRLGGNDSPLILSLITVSVIAHKIEKLPLEIVCTLLMKVPVLLETNFDLYIKVGLGFSFQLLEIFDKEIIPRKPIHTPKKSPSQPKGEIPRKYIKVINAFESFAQSAALKKLSAKNDEMGRMGKKALGDFGAFLKKMSGLNRPKK